MSRVDKPWGYYETLFQTTGYLVKRIVVHPGHQLSLQYHHYRSESWTICSGNAKVQIGEDVFILTTNQQVFVPKMVKHRITNVGQVNVEFVEVQIGHPLLEEDIVRLEDAYQR
jgi:mannose-1-phosphate guanylyltransferase/mannose-6-phosphate isomerase